MENEQYCIVNCSGKDSSIRWLISYGGETHCNDLHIHFICFTNRHASAFERSKIILVRYQKDDPTKIKMESTSKSTFLNELHWNEGI